MDPIVISIPWAVPTFTRRYAPDGTALLPIINEGLEGRQGREVTVIEAERCMTRWPEGHGAEVCGLVQGHFGPHWVCQAYLVEKMGGAMAVVVP